MDLLYESFHPLLTTVLNKKGVGVVRNHQISCHTLSDKATYWQSDKLTKWQNDKSTDWQTAGDSSSRHDFVNFSTARLGDDGPDAGKATGKAGMSHSHWWAICKF